VSGALQPFPRLPCLGQSPRVSSNPVSTLGRWKFRLALTHMQLSCQAVMVPIFVRYVRKGNGYDNRRNFAMGAI
jgi:hypothetical protein